MKRGYFFVGDAPHHMYVDYQLADHKRFPYPVVLVHGGQHSGLGFFTTPDGREGWATLFPSMGFDTYVVDLPGQGRSGVPDDYLTLSTLVRVDRVRELLRRLNGAVVIGHSGGGLLLWKLADSLPPEERHLLKGAVGLAATPLPGDWTQPIPLRREDRPLRAARDSILGSFVVRSPRFPQQAVEEYFKTLVPDSPRAVNECLDTQARGVMKVSGPETLQGIPAMLLCGEEEGKLLADRERSAAFLGIPALRLGRDWGLHGHGHMLILEHGNDEIARRLAEWLFANVK
ncbi:MAG: alpha/beta fold hydrolase [Chloroflexi bacterium]|nr:alpha/beta fold hydrolase [Chloroflexota bacterium]